VAQKTEVSNKNSALLAEKAQ